MPNRETTIGQNTQLSEKICSCFSLRPWPSPRLIRLSPRLIRPLADSGGIFARDICMVFALLLSICANQRKSAVKYPVFVRDREGFCLSTLPTNKKRSSLRPLRLCGELIFFCVNLRESAVKFLGSYSLRKSAASISERFALCAMRFAVLRSAGSRGYSLSVQVVRTSSRVVTP